MRTIFHAASFVVLLFLYVPLLGQQITTVESRCINTGQIIISGVVGAGGPYQLSLVSYPVAYLPGAAHAVANLPDTFNTLYPGTYSLKVIDRVNSVSVFTGIQVAGNYVSPGNNSYQPIATGVSNCSFPNGTISGVMTQGRPPYTYRILSGPAQVGVINGTGSFTGLIAGTYQVQAGDSCQNVQTRTVTIAPYIAPGSLYISQALINRVACDSFSLDGLTTIPIIGSGYRYEVINANLAPSPGLFSSNSLPLRFKGAKTDIAAGKITVRVLDSCGSLLGTYLPRGFSNEWNFSASFTPVCGGALLQAIDYGGWIPPPALIKVKAVYKRPGGAPDSTITQVAAVLPFSVQGIAAGADSLVVTVIVTDACGETQVRKYELASTLMLDSIRFASCTRTNLKLSLKGVPAGQVIYSVMPANGIASNTTGVFQLPDGVYNFIAVDSCSNTDTLGPIAITRGWKAGRVEQLKLCNPGFLTNRVYIPARSVGRVTIRQYSGAGPISSSAVPTAQRIYTGQQNGCVTCGQRNDTGEFIQFDSIAPGSTFTYIVMDTCGTADTVTLVNDSVPYQGFYHRTTVKSKCINKGDILVSWNNSSSSPGSVRIDVYTNNSLFFSFQSSSASNLTAYPSGQPLLTDYPVGVYIVKYRLTACDIIYADTVHIAAYEQPVVVNVQSLLACTGTNFPIVVTANKGVAPYTYQIISTTPDQLTGPEQSSTQFNLPIAQATATIRVLDACLNSITSTVAITSSTAPSIRVDPVAAAACTLPFSFRLITDSLYAGAMFEWTKITGSGAGATIIGMRPVLPLLYNSIADTGTYKLRVRIPGTCYDMLAYHTVAPVAITCSPAISGTILNDANGLNDSRVNGQPAHVNGLYVYLVNAANTILASSAVAANGTYYFLNVPNGSYAVVLSSTAAATGTTAPAASAGPGWVNTGEQLGLAAGSDGIADGILRSVSLQGATINNANFGIDRRPVANGVMVIQPNPGGLNAVPVPVLTGFDAEDGLYDGISGINSIIIQTLPANAQLTYNGIVVTAGQVITGYNPGLLKIDPVEGIVTATFTYSVVDAASVASLPATVTLIFDNRPSANADSALVVVGGQAVIAVGVNDAYGADGPLAGSITIVQVPTHGTAVVDDGGTPLDPTDDQIVYTGAAGFAGVDTLVYKICDRTGDCDTALVLVYVGSTVPLRLLQFSARLLERTVLLQWTVADAHQASAYEMWHSTDGRQFSLLNRVTATDQVNYKLLDPGPYPGINYYRLKLIDQNGSSSWSRWQQVNLGVAEPVLTVQPNPFDDFAMLDIVLQKPGPVIVYLYDAAGQLMRKYSFQGMAGGNRYMLNPMGSLSSGLYWIKVQVEGRYRKQRLIKL